MLSALLRAGRSLTAGLSGLSSADSILMSYQKPSRGRDEERLCAQTLGRCWTSIEPLLDFQFGTELSMFVPPEGVALLLAYTQRQLLPL